MLMSSNPTIISILLFAFWFIITLTSTNATKVVIVGAGVSGLTAATELALRGYEVVIHERQSIPGGKIKAYRSPNGLPMEHGFHFFPGEYQNLPRTFAQIPYNGGTLWDHLVSPSEVGLAFEGSPIVSPTRVFDSWDDIIKAVRAVVKEFQLGLSAKEVEFWSARYISYLSSCDARRRGQFQNMSYTQAVAPGGKKCWSKAYWELLVDGLSIDLVASRPELMSADTMMQVLVGLLWGEVGRNNSLDRIFNGPGDDVWTGPWVKYLESLGVVIHYNHYITKLNLNPHTSTLSGIEYTDTVTGMNGVDNSASYYLVAIPMERMVALGRNSSLFQYDTKLSSIQKLEALWMNGVFIYLRENVDVVKGHVDFVGSPWALTMISAAQFWPNYNWSREGDGKARGLLSLIISDWFTPGHNGKRAADCTPNEIINEIATQINAVYPNLITSHNVHSWFIDHDITYHEPLGLNTNFTSQYSSVDALPLSKLSQNQSSPIRSFTTPTPWHLEGVKGFEGVPTSSFMSNAEPLMVNNVGSWWSRPDGPTTALKNMFISGDYVKTSFQLACAEGANEAGKYAVNAILQADGYSGDNVRLYPFEYPKWLQALQQKDCDSYHNNPDSRPPLWVEDPQCGSLHH